MGFSRQEYWSGVPLPSPELFHSTLYIGSWVPEDMPGCEATCEPRPKAGQAARELEENEESDDSLLLQILMVSTQEPAYLWRYL